MAARVPYLNAEDLSDADKDLLKRPIWLTRALVNSPGTARAFHVLGNHIRYGMTLDMRLRELAILQVGWLARSPFEWSHHVKLGMDFGVSKEDIEGLIAETEGRDSDLGALEKKILRAAREMTENVEMPEPLFRELQAELGNEQMVDLVVAISTYCAVVRILASLAIEVEPEYQPYLDMFPLPAN
ncbi:MAG: carboxymuconolactone decarboxylase family protein [Alphaproteobacteria bacterium]|nr:carboxymuconolactone decarboxylase family protein [Alphaproteobacteria bacterium]MCB9929635.1 carboxymuconolactone decarboxylase family protein [Alphaproteobacteria bacterium]